MRIKDILHTTEHRPWPMPYGQWKYYQEWNDAIFLHYRVDKELLRIYVPDMLEIDVIDGEAWVSLVAFTMEKIRPLALPSLAPLSNFYEINIRTYVKCNGKAGVYFLSIEAGKRLSGAVARMLSDLPYRYSQMRRSYNEYRSQNSRFHDAFRLQYQVGTKYDHKSKHDVWLTERYALFQDANSQINAFDIHHVEWPVYAITPVRLEVNYERFHPLVHNAPDMQHYSPGVQVLAWGKQKIVGNACR